MIFDTHAHYDDEQFDEDRDSLLNKLHGENVGRIVNICAEVESFGPVLDLCEKYPFIYAAVGVHPDDVGKLDDELFARISEAAGHEKCVAIGEIGLDYYWDKASRDVQEKWFREQINLAKRLNKPIVVHSRDAAADTLRIIKDEKAFEAGGVIHCFSYEPQMAAEYIKMGFYLGVGGVLTFKNSRKLKEVVQMCPLSQLVVETDCPYLAPVPHRGERNNSGYISLVLEELARIKGLSLEEAEEATWENAMRLYRMKE